MVANAFEPGMRQGLVQGYPFFRPLDQKLCNEVNTCAAAVLPLRRIKDYLVLASHSNCFFLGVVIKWETRADEGVKNATKTPQVALE
jgi:hypothetical protein